MSLIERGSLRTYRFKKNLILCFFLMYTLVQCAGNNLSSRGEFFPVFGWSLFSHNINPAWTLELEITRIGELNLPKPMNFFELGDYFIMARSRSTLVTKNMRRIYHIYKTDPTTAASMLKEFERSFLNGYGRVDYRFVSVRFDSLVRWQTGEVIERNVVAQFSTEKGQ